MNKEKRKIKVSLLFAYAIFAFLFLFMFLGTPFAGNVASAEDGISTYSVDTNDVTTRYAEYDRDTIENNIPSTLYYDQTLTNDGNSNILSDDWFSWSAGAGEPPEVI